MIYFVRHGQSTANAGGVTMAHAEIPLSELGRRQAALVATLLDVEPVLLLSSTYLRAMETARPFSEKLRGRNAALAQRHGPLRARHLVRTAGLIEGMVTAQRRPMAEAFWLCWKLWGFTPTDATVMREFRRFQRALPMPNCAVYGLEQAAKGQWRLQANEAVMQKVAAAAA